MTPSSLSEVIYGILAESQAGSNYTPDNVVPIDRGRQIQLDDAIANHNRWCGCLSRRDRFGQIEPCGVAERWLEDNNGGAA